MELLIGLVVQVALIYLWVKLFRLARSLRNAAAQRWRRRFGLFFFFLPVVLFGLDVVLPDSVFAYVAWLGVVNKGIDWTLTSLLALSSEHLGTLWGIALKPLVYAVVYTVAGVAVGWPLDRIAAWRRGPAAEAPAPQGGPAAG